MNRKVFGKILDGLKVAYEERTHSGLNEDAIRRIMTEVRQTTVRPEPLRPPVVPFEVIASRFAAACCMFALVVIAYGRTEGVGLTSINDIYPRETIQLFMGPGII